MYLNCLEETQTGQEKKALVSDFGMRENQNQTSWNRVISLMEKVCRIENNRNAIIYQKASGVRNMPAKYFTIKCFWFEFEFCLTTYQPLWVI